MDLASSDLLWSLFSSSLTSYRKDSVLRPFPPNFLKEHDEKDFDQLNKVAKLCPSLEDVNNNPQDVDPRVIKLLRWVLNPKNFTLTCLGKGMFSEIHQLVLDAGGRNALKVSEPNYIFELQYSSSQEEKFQKLKGSKRLLHAFHGSKIENFYSILNCGLRNNLNKVALYGEGIYLSSDLTLSLTYSPSGQGWDQSMFGNSLCCVALCEMIDHPDVKCTLKNCESLSEEIKEEEIPLDGSVQQSSTSCLSSSSACMENNSLSNQNVVHRTSLKRSKIAGSEGGEIPEKYFVVRNDDLVRVKYLLLYCPHVKSSQMLKSKLFAIKFFRRHQFLLTMILYILILLIPCLYNSSKK